VPTPRYRLTAKGIQNSLDELALRDSRIARALHLVGYPEERRRSGGVDALVRTVIGQQVSTHAARAITLRLVDVLGGELGVSAIMAASDEALRGAGLSRQKSSYLRALAEAVSGEMLVVDDLPTLSDEQVITLITGVKGFGVWSAQMYLMFSLGRLDVWPTGDLAVRAGFGRIMTLSDRPTPKQTHTLAEPFRPHRSALALLCWKFYSEAPL